MQFEHQGVTRHEARDQEHGFLITAGQAGTVKHRGPAQFDPIEPPARFTPERGGGEFYGRVMGKRVVIVRLGRQGFVVLELP